jgi:hypothetical protein
MDRARLPSPRGKIAKIRDFVRAAVAAVPGSHLVCMKMPVRFIVEIVPRQGLIARGIDTDIAVTAPRLHELERVVAERVLRELGAEHVVRLLLGGGSV